jgi:hypothetical protein
MISPSIVGLRLRNTYPTGLLRYLRTAEKLKDFIITAIMIQMKLLNKYRANKYGKHIFNFPDKQRLYQLKEDYFEKLPSYKLEYIQENTNYIAHLGVAKHTLNAANEKTISEADKVGALLPVYTPDKKQFIISADDLERAHQSLANIKTTQAYVKTNIGEYDKTNEHIIVSLFDMFFFFEDENIFEFTEEALEKKRYYLKEYPYFRNFFFRKLESYISDYKITYDNCTRFAILQTGIQEVVRGLDFTSIQEAGTVLT